VDGDLRLSYEQFFDRCDAWSAALQALGVKQGDRVAYIAPNTHAQLESFYAVPQIGAVLVPLNYRLTADDFSYLIQHSGARVVCADIDYLERVDSIRSKIPDVSAFVALGGSKPGWLDYAIELKPVARDVITNPFFISLCHSSCFYSLESTQQQS
jgi:fatty-acyl-CoA synthase